MKRPSSPLQNLYPRPELRYSRCLICGTPKASPPARCPQCGHKPGDHRPVAASAAATRPEEARCPSCQTKQSSNALCETCLVHQLQEDREFRATIKKALLQSALILGTSLGICLQIAHLELLLAAAISSVATLTMFFYVSFSSEKFGRMVRHRYIGIIAGIIAKFVALYVISVLVLDGIFWVEIHIAEALSLWVFVAMFFSIENKIRRS